MLLVLTPNHGSNRVFVPVKHPQAFAGLRVPEPDIAGARKQPSLIGMPGLTLRVGPWTFDHPQAAPVVDLPEPDRPIATSGNDSGLACVENGVINPVRVTFERLQQFPGSHVPKSDNSVSRSREKLFPGPTEFHRANIGSTIIQNTKTLA